MAENGYGHAPVAGYIGRIPNYGKTPGNPMGGAEPPACIQNAMMTKDKKPFTYTPGGLDLSQIKTPSMARRLARQRSQEEHEQAYAQHPHPGGNYHTQGGPAGPGGPPPPPLPASKIPAPPPPPSLVIEAPNAKSTHPPTLGERPEIVIPENPIGMLRKTNSPYHWEAEKAEMQKMGSVPKFQEKVPSPLTVKMPPSTFSQQPPQPYTPQGQNFQRPQYGHQNSQPGSPIHRPEAQYANQKSGSPNVNGSPITRELLQRQDSQFNKSPQPFAGQSPVGSGSPYSPTPNNNWRQPDRRDSPSNNVGPQYPQQNRNQFSPHAQQYPPANNGPQSPQQNQNQFSPHTQQYSPNYQVQSPPESGPVYHTLPRSVPRAQENHINNTQNNNAIYNNTRDTAPHVDSSDPYPWRTNTMNRQQPPREPENLQSIYHNSQNINQQPKFTPPWANTSNEPKNTQQENNYIPPWKQENKNAANQQQQQQYGNQWATQDSNNNRSHDNYSPPWKGQQNDYKPTPISPPSRQNQQQEQPRYQSTMSIPVTPRKPNTQPEQNNNVQKEVVYVNQEPVYFCPESPKAMPAFVKTQKEKTKTPPPAWCQRPLEGRKSVPRELVTPPRETNQEPEWIRKSNEMQRGVREVISPPKYQQQAQPTWSTRPSDNRKSLPRDNAPGSPGARVIPIQMEVSSSESRDQGRQNQQPPLRIVINMQPGNMPSTQGPYSQPTQRIMRVLSPQLVRLDDGSSQNDLPSLNRNFQPSQESQGPKERIIPIQIEGGGNNGPNKRVYYHKFVQEGQPRQSRAFRVLQVITGTQDVDDIQGMENQHGFTDL